MDYFTSFHIGFPMFTFSSDISRAYTTPSSGRVSAMLNALNPVNTPK